MQAGQQNIPTVAWGYEPPDRSIRHPFKATLMTGHFHTPIRPSRLTALIRYLGDVLDHLFGEPYTQTSLAMSRRHQLSLAMESARRLRRGGGR